jgi:hypothetical protein
MDGTPKVLTSTELKGHPRFYELLKQIAQLHSDKNADYATDQEPLSNLRACEEINIPAWQGTIVRMMDKWDRIKKLTVKGKATVENESIKDTLMDNAVYSLLCIILIEEQEKQ